MSKDGYPFPPGADTTGWQPLTGNPLPNAPAPDFKVNTAKPGHGLIFEPDVLSAYAVGIKSQADVGWQPSAPAMERYVATLASPGREMTAEDLGLDWYGYHMRFLEAAENMKKNDAILRNLQRSADINRRIGKVLREAMSEPVALPLMSKPMPDTAERKRLEMQAIPMWHPAKEMRPQEYWDEIMKGRRADRLSEIADKDEDR